MVNKKNFIGFANRRGWIKVAEAVVALLLITGIVLLYVNKGQLGLNRYSEEINDAQIAILNFVQSNQEYRELIVGIKDDRIPITWNGEFETNATLKPIKEEIVNRTPDYLNCSASICSLDDLCLFEDDIEKELYSKSVAISATLTSYNPRQLKLFCHMIE